LKTSGRVDDVKSELIRILDLVLAPFAPFAAALSLLLARTMGQMSICTRIFDWFQVYPIRHHYYSPLTYESDLRVPLEDERVVNGLDLNPQGQLSLLARFRYRDELLAIARRARDTLSYGYQATNFGSGDAEYFYNIIRHFKPRRILEIGSGQSTLLAKLAIEANQHESTDYQCVQICVEPFEQPWLEQSGVSVHRTKIELLPPSVVDQLLANDILFIDSSHVIRPQGDVLHEYLTLLGRLKRGVLVHVHDIFTPRNYPAKWVLRDRRLWNEQYLLEAFLCFNHEFQVIGALNWLWHNHRERLGDACPVLMTQPHREPGSFWMMRA
jgi:hypothetical protein